MKCTLLNISSLLCIALMTGSCKKYLETKSVQTLATPSTLSDLEAILNHPQNANRGTVLLNGLSDEYYFLYNDWQSRIELQKKGYVWDSQLNDYNDWRDQYAAVYYSNTVLFNLRFISANGENERWNAIKGAALFYRALAFYRVAQLYAPQYDAASASTDLGIPLRLNADINEVSTRSTVKQTYDQIINDLNSTLDLVYNNLPNNAANKTQATKAAVYGLLAKVYLQIGDYQKAKESADACLQIYNTLMDYNDITWVNASSSSPFKVLNPEIILYSNANATTNSNSTAKVDSNLYKSYDINDLRKTAYFSKNSDNSYRFKGSYNVGFTNLFCGIATDEMYLIRAECYAREGSVQSAMKDLNDLLRTRWKKISGTTTYVDQTAANSNDALTKILTERKKELVYRELRWPDLRRLNKETAFATTINRNLNGQLFTLTPNDPKYTLLIPQEILRLVDLTQNAR